jgi:hypothetical protein
MQRLDTMPHAAACAGVWIELHGRILATSNAAQVRVYPSGGYPVSTDSTSTTCLASHGEGCNKSTNSNDRGGKEHNRRIDA